MLQLYVWYDLYDVKKIYVLSETASPTFPIKNSASAPGKNIEQINSISVTVAYPVILFGGIQQINLRTERTGIWGR